MDVTVNHLIRRNGKFYYRSRLPIRHSKEWKKELKLSIQTSDLKKAVLTCRLISEKVQQLIEQEVFEMIPIPEIRRILADFITDDLGDYARFLFNYGKISSQERENVKW